MMAETPVTILDPEIAMKMGAMSQHGRTERQELWGWGSPHHPRMTISKFLLWEGEQTSTS